MRRAFHNRRHPMDVARHPSTAALCLLAGYLRSWTAPRFSSVRILQKRPRLNIVVRCSSLWFCDCKPYRHTVRRPSGRNQNTSSSLSEINHTIKRKNSALTLPVTLSVPWRPFIYNIYLVGIDFLTNNKSVSDPKSSKKGTIDGPNSLTMLVASAIMDSPATNALGMFRCGNGCWPGASQIGFRHTWRTAPVISH